MKSKPKKYEYKENCKKKRCLEYDLSEKNDHIRKFNIFVYFVYYNYCILIIYQYTRVFCLYNRCL